MIATGREMPDYGRLLIFLLNPDDAAAPRQLFERCTPRSPHRTSPLDGGAAYVRQEWARTFEAPLLASVENLASPIRAAKSPIITTIAALTQRPDFDASVHDRRLIMFSDLLEHDPGPAGYSQLRRSELVAAYRRSPLAQSISADLRRVKVTVDYLQRSEPDLARGQTQAHRDFWRWWFSQAGAAEISFIGIREADDTWPPPAQRHETPVLSRG